MKIIDIETWDRKEHFEFFRRSDYGHYHIGATIDITGFKSKTKNQAIPFSFALTYIVTQAINAVEQFRYRIENGQVVLHEQVHPYFAYIAPDKKYFKMVLAEISGDISAFAQKAREKALAQNEYFIREDTSGRSDLIFISSIPNVAFTHLSHTMTLSNKDDAFPRLSWGKYFEEGGKLLLPFNIQAHHAFVDGEHMGAFFDTLQHMLNVY